MKNVSTILILILCPLFLKLTGTTLTIAVLTDRQG